MKRNVGPVDRWIRFLIGIVLATLFFTQTVTGFAGYIIAFLACSIPLSGLIGYCPFYTLFGVSTCKIKQKVE
jgi:hypothetical protein